MEENSTYKRKKTDGLLFGFALIFGIFTIVTLVMSALTIYAIQMREYKARRVEEIRKIGDYLERLIQEAGPDFIN